MNTDLPIEVVEELLKAGGFGEIPEPDPETARELERANRALAKRLKSGPLLVVDGEHPTEDEFLANLALASERLTEKLMGVVRWLATQTGDSINP